MGILHRLFGRNKPAIWRAERRLLHQLGFVQPPQAVQWISTSICDLSCPHCYSHAGHKTAGELTTDEAKTLLIDELVQLERPTFVIAGGEALLRKDFGEIVAYAHQSKVSWALHSHGGRVEHLFDVIQQYPPVMAAISLVETGASPRVAGLVHSRAAIATKPRPRRTRLPTSISRVCRENRRQRRFTVTSLRTL